MSIHTLSQNDAACQSTPSANPGIIWRYEPPDIQSLLNVHDLRIDKLSIPLGDLYDDLWHLWRSFLRVKLSRRDDGSVAKAVIDRWKHPKPLPVDDLMNHARQDDAILGWIPAHALMAVADVDVDRSGGQTMEERVKMVMGALGRPMMGCRAKSGGWHLWYAIQGAPEARSIRAGKQRIGGVHWGEIACLSRIINVWHPQMLEQVVKRRVSGMGLRYINLAGLDVAAPIDKAPRIRTGGSNKITIDEMASALGLDWDDTQQHWVGGCPVCAKSGDAGKTRFKLKPYNGTWSAYCWTCLGGDLGRRWSTDEMNTLLAPARAIRDAATEAFLGDLIKPITSRIDNGAK